MDDIMRPELIKDPCWCSHNSCVA